MDLLQNLYIIGEFSLLHKVVLTLSVVLFFTVVIFWSALVLNCVIGNVIIDNIDRKRDKFEDIIVKAKSISDIPHIPQKDIPIFAGVIIKYKGLVAGNDFVKQVFTKTHVLRYYHRMTKALNWKARVRAVRVLGEIGYADFFYWIKPLTRDKSVFVRDEALLAISKLQSHAAAQYLMDYIESNYDSNIRWIDLILQNLAKQESLIFVPYLDTKNIYLKHKILDTIRYMHLIEYLPRIMLLFSQKDNDEETDIKCIFILALFPANETKKFLMEKLNLSANAGPDIRKFIALALYKIDLKLNPPSFGGAGG